MKVTPNQLKLLPTGGGYFEKQGQANLNIKKGEGDTIYIEASCDSLNRVIELFEEENFRLHQLLEEKEFKPPSAPSGWQWFWIRIGQLSVAAAIGWVAIRYIKKRVNFKKMKSWL